MPGRLPYVLNEKRYRVYLHRLYTRYVLITKQLLLNFNFSASLFELRFDLFCLFLGNAFLDCLRSTVDTAFGGRSSGNGNSSSSGLNSVFFLQNTSKFVNFFNCQVYQLLS